MNRYYVNIKLNARLLPVDRVCLFEEPLDYALKDMKIGELIGGGTSLFFSREVSGCDIDFYLYEKNELCYNKLKSFLSFLGIPKNSELIIDGVKEKFGELEGLALYLNGTELEDDIYKLCDVNYVITQIANLLGKKMKFYSYWEGPKETAIYFYVNSFYETKNLIMPFIENYPLCKKCRIVQIA